MNATWRRCDVSLRLAPDINVTTYLLTYPGGYGLGASKYSRRANIADSAHFRETAKDAGAA